MGAKSGCSRSKRPTAALVLFSRWDLGTDPLEVLDALTAAGYAGRHRR